VILIMTSNLGSQQMKQGSKVGFDRMTAPTKSNEEDRSKRARDVMIEVERFSGPVPEPRGRLVVFNPLSHEDLPGSCTCSSTTTRSARRGVSASISTRLRSIT
jgi:ATP-dependent Clp protease ATP-binding subunit ClpA